MLNYATASRSGRKNRAYNELQKLAGMIVRNAAWRQLDQNVMAKIVRRIFELLGQRVTKKIRAVALPIVGVAVGAASMDAPCQAADEGD